MPNSLEALANMEYPGRFIIIGRDITGGNYVVVYGITGRSKPSQARRLNFVGDGVYVEPTDEEALKKGNPELLIYPAIGFKPGGIVVSNGRQTIAIEEKFDASIDPKEILEKALSDWEYEPDEPNYTPRISGCVTGISAALSIIKRAEEGIAERLYFDVSLNSGKGKLIATYTGANVNPLPSFQGAPLDVELKGDDAEKTAELVYEALAPKITGNDFRVSVASLYCNPSTGTRKVEIINRCDLRGE